MKIEEIIKQPEGRKIEFKETLPRKSELNKTVVAFANDAGGQLFIGIKDYPREIIGLDEEQLIRMEEEISNSIHDNCNPVILPEIMFLNHQGKHILVVNIHKGSNPPYYLKSKGKTNGTYIRVGSTNRLADSDIIEELERQKQNISFDSLIVHSKTFQDLELSSFKNHFEEITGEKVNETVLEKMNLIVRDQNRKFPTNALILLSGDPLRNALFPYAKIECARFKGTTPGNFIDQKTIDTPLSLQAEEAYKFILRHISQGSTYEGVYRKDRWEYPVVALREVIRNAVIHRDYSLRGKDIKVAVFDDKIEITSPGKLLPTVDFNDMEAGQSDIRNITLAPVFKKLGIIEQWGNGLQLIAGELKKYPEIQMRWSEPGMGFRVTFVKENFVEQQELQQETRTITTNYDRLRPITTDYDRLTIEEQKILLFLLDNMKISRKYAVDLLDVKETKAKEIFNMLLNKKLIERKGKGRSTFYTLKNKGSNE
ncbi:putative DNA binding domain-containing protein [Candidatus Sulfidibacterium hydrothermale]|uniref:RNA-binding domain-containing protein n=1 Tax=Candidatus Sulfidibacterium hydrothermale TaxID=2875962 RepID=UPI001F0A647D|nr:RNA-binding domain-containing protein [Candidatus Sulfidibacterium hydrothermale]UBM62787.1 putative DNA binding domain-containing protein [Candidatus Sulfidibacterium hydrothermale]